MEKSGCIGVEYFFWFQSENLSQHGNKRGMQLRKLPGRRRLPGSHTKEKSTFDQCTKESEPGGFRNVLIAQNRCCYLRKSTFRHSDSGGDFLIH